MGYLNVEPLVCGLENDPLFRVCRESPARVAEALHAGEIDAGMIPSIEYAYGRYDAVRGLGIASRGAVRSVCLFHRRPLAQVRSIAVDTSSRTSVALLRILMRERGLSGVSMTEASPDVRGMLLGADAALVIGDAALAAAGDTPHLDLGRAWTDLTGLPFVYAFWAGVTDGLDAVHVERLERALEEGLPARELLASRYNGAVALDPAVKVSYLRDAITYRLGAEEYAGLREFYRLAHEMTLIPEAPDLRFYGDR